MEADDDALAATFDAANTLSCMFAELLVQLTKTDALGKAQVAEILVANERFIAGLHQTKQARTALLYQAVHDRVLSFVERKLPVKPLVERRRQQLQKSAPPHEPDEGR